MTDGFFFEGLMFTGTLFIAHDIQTLIAWRGTEPDPGQEMILVLMTMRTEPVPCQAMILLLMTMRTAVLTLVMVVVVKDAERKVAIESLKGVKKGTCCLCAWI